MKLKEMYVRNFRGYKEKKKISFEDGLTAITGRNDVGKSTILEALEIFFNNKNVKIEQSDLNISAEEAVVEIGCVFDELSPQIIVDEEYPTSFSREYLVNSDGCVEVVKQYKIQKTVSSPSIYINCVHPKREGFDNLHGMKMPALRALGKELDVEDEVEDKRVSSLWRHAIWNKCDDLQLGETLLDIGSLERDSKAIYKKIEEGFPTFALFKSDRESSDADPEAKNPMQVAVDQAKKALQHEIDELQEKIERAVIEVAERTKVKIGEMDPELASELHPRFKDKPKWTFNFTLDGEGGVPINKRGSGVRRLILLNFFRAEAEKKRVEEGASRVIYAIEEPETSQHPNYQKMLIDALLNLSFRPECQIVLTTHVPALAGLLPTESIRFIEKGAGHEPIIEHGGDDVLEKVADSLGVLPESDIAGATAVLLVEGHSDVTFVNHSSEVLKSSGDVRSSLPELGIASIPIGGCGNLKHWVSKKLVERLGLEWDILLDSDIGDQRQNQQNIAKIQELKDEGRIAILTRKREPENYIDPALIEQIHGVLPQYTDTCDAKKIIAGETQVKAEKVLEKFWPQMTPDQIKAMSMYVDQGEERCEIIEIIDEVSTLAR